MRSILVTFALLALFLAGGSHTVVHAQVPSNRCCLNHTPPPTPTPAPTPTPVPTPTPTPTPLPPNQYVYDGVNIWPASDTFTKPYASASIDPNSALIISQLPAGTFNDEGNVTHAYQVNAGTSATPTFTVQHQSGGHTPPCYTPFVAGAWVDGWFIESVTDHHAVNLITDTGASQEYYSVNWTPPSGPLGAYSCQQNNLNATWLSQWVATHNAVTASGLPYMGTTDWQDDPSVINHIMSFAMKTGHGLSQWGYVFPATHPAGIADTACSGGPCHHPLHYGDILILDPAFDCSPYTSVGQRVCNQWKDYGLVVRDQASGYTPTFGNALDGTQWNYSADLSAFFAAVGPNNLKVIQEPTINCYPGHTYGSDCF